MSLSVIGCGNANPVTNKQSTSTSTGQGKLEVYYLDVWQGDSILIHTPKGESVLIDGGNNQMGDTVVHDIQNLHINEINAMIATHPDADHIGGLDTVLKNIKIDNVYTPKVTSNTKTYEDFIMAVKDKGLKLKEAKEGVSIDLQGVIAKFVGPVKTYGTETNDWSAVLKLTYGKNSFLFTGDAPILSEHDMIASGEDLHADVLKVGHHGAKTATSQAFLDAVKPKYAVISVGKGNDYGHPTAEVLNRLHQNHVETYRTDEIGTVEAISDGNTITFEDAKTNSEIAKNMNRLVTPTSTSSGNHRTQRY
jgi:competence protein ComEC